MFSGALGKACFGPSEIQAMRRALLLAERAICHETEASAPLPEQRQDVARAIVKLAAHGHLDPLVLSAMAVKSRRNVSEAVFHPYARRAQAGRPHPRHIVASRKTA